MTSTMYVALLRGVNVGGKHRLPMQDLAQMFRDAGCADVRTYILKTVSTVRNWRTVLALLEMSGG